MERVLLGEYSRVNKCRGNRVVRGYECNWQRQNGGVRILTRSKLGHQVVIQKDIEVTPDLAPDIKNLNYVLNTWWDVAGLAEIAAICWEKWGKVEECAP